MDITVELPTNKTIPVHEVLPGTTIENLKRRIYDECKIHPREQRIYFAGKQLEDQRTLSDYNVTHRAVLQLARAIHPKWPRHPEDVYQYDSDIQHDAESKFRDGAVECSKAVKAMIINFYALTKKHSWKSPTFCAVEDLLSQEISTSVSEPNGVPDFRWIHLPANNINWVERLVSVIFAEEAALKKKHMRDATLSGIGREAAPYLGEGNDGATELLLLPLRHPRMHYVSRGSKGQVLSRFMKPCYSRVSRISNRMSPTLLTPYEDRRVNCFAFIPFIDWEHENMHNERKKCLRKLATDNPTPPNGADWNELPMAAKVLYSYFWDKSPIHDRRTLDQAFYYTMSTEEAWKRDSDEGGGQVLHRHFQKRGDKLVQEEPRLFMVDQLWIWVIETLQVRTEDTGITLLPMKTVVTAFPSQWTREEAPEDRPSGDDERIIAALAAPDARGRVLNALYGDQISQVLSVTDLICLIIEKCSGLFHPTPQEVSDPFDYLEVFNVAIGETASGQSKLTSSLRTHCIELNKHLRHKNSLFRQKFTTLLSQSGDRQDLSEVEDQIDEHMRILSDISKETTYLSEIKDIMDELNILSNIYSQQILVVQSMIDDAKAQKISPLTRTPVLQLTLFPSRGGDDDKDRKKAESSRQPEDDSTPEVDCTLKDTGDDSSSESGSTCPSPQFDALVVEGPSEHAEAKYEALELKLAGRKQSIEHLRTRALGVYKELCDILDLKQKQATIFQAMSARQESKEAERQGQTIMLFTIITIIFLPLSFIAAIYSMNATEINNSDRPIRDIFKIMFPTTVGILLVSLLLAYNNRFKQVAVFTYNVITKGNPIAPDEASKDKTAESAPREINKRANSGDGKGKAAMTAFRETADTMSVESKPTDVRKLIQGSQMTAAIRRSWDAGNKEAKPSAQREADIAAIV